MSENIVETKVLKTNFFIRPIENKKEMTEVYSIVHDAFVRRGYSKPQKNGQLRYNNHLDGILQTTVFVAIENKKVIGTVSFSIDGDKGLNVDSDFLKETNIIRQENRNLGSAWRMATLPEYRNNRKLLMGLIKTTVQYWIDNKIETVLFTFHRRHEEVYNRILGSQTIARSNKNVDGFQNAPAVLLRWDIENCPTKWLDTITRKKFKELIIQKPTSIKHKTT